MELCRSCVLSAFLGFCAVIMSPVAPHPYLARFVTLVRSAKIDKSRKRPSSGAGKDLFCTSCLSDLVPESQTSLSFVVVLENRHRLAGTFNNEFALSHFAIRIQNLWRVRVTRACSSNFQKTSRLTPFLPGLCGSRLAITAPGGPLRTRSSPPYQPGDRDFC